MDGRGSSSSRRSAATSILKVVGASSLSELLLPPDHLEVAVVGARRAVEAQVACLEKMREGVGSWRRPGLYVGSEANLVLGMLGDVHTLHAATATSIGASKHDSSKGDDATNWDIGTCINKASSSPSNSSSSSRGTASSISCSDMTSGSSMSSSSGRDNVSSGTSISEASSSSCSRRGTVSSSSSSSKHEAGTSSASSEASVPLHRTGRFSAPFAPVQLLKLLLELIALLGQAEQGS